MHRTPPLTFDPAAAQAWLLGPSDEFDDLSCAESLVVDDELTAPGVEGFLRSVEDVLAAWPDGLRRHADVTAVGLWLIPDGDVLDQGALITVDLANGLRLATLHQDVRDFADRDQRGVPPCSPRSGTSPTRRPGWWSPTTRPVLSPVARCRDDQTRHGRTGRCIRAGHVHPPAGPRPAQRSGQRHSCGRPRRRRGAPRRHQPHGQRDARLPMRRGRRPSGRGRSQLRRGLRHLLGWIEAAV